MEQHTEQPEDFLLAEISRVKDLHPLDSPEAAKEFTLPLSKLPSHITSRVDLTSALMAAGVPPDSRLGMKLYNQFAFLKLR